MHMNHKKAKMFNPYSNCFFKSNVNMIHGGQRLHRSRRDIVHQHFQLGRLAAATRAGALMWLVTGTVYPLGC